MRKTDDSNLYFQLATSFIRYTDRMLFLTGKAGTGKTTFLHHIKKETEKKTVVVAPTGVAAINAGGVTMHSFFQLPFGPFVPVPGAGGINQIDARALLSNIRFNQDKRKLIRELELLIIDEVSMVRADMLDAMDVILRHVRKKEESFGGVQVLFIGDLYQLSPVATEEDWNTLRPYYKGVFFFHAHVMQQCPPVCIELSKVYRQNEGHFIELLNHVRENKMTERDFELLNRKYQPSFQPPEDKHYIILTSHNHKANKINEQELKRLPGKVYAFDAFVEGEFSEKAFPADTTLRLKEGAQVMFIRNDKGESRRYYNGKIATVERIDEGAVHVSFPDEEGELKLEEEEWKNIRYVYDEEDGILEEELGSFRQLPIRLAWAVTIHKSQGLTFERAIIDAGDSFASGQVYVALSRLTSIEGMVLKSEIRPEAVRSDESVRTFMQMRGGEEGLKQTLKTEQRNFIEKQLLKSFDWEKLAEGMNEHWEEFGHRKIANQEEAEAAARSWLQKTLAQREVAEKFARQLRQLLKTNGEKPDYDRIFERVQAASDYFEGRLKEELLEPVSEHYEAYKKIKRTKKYVRQVSSLMLLVKEQLFRIERALQLAEGFRSGWDNDRLLVSLKEKRAAHARQIKQENKKPQRGETYRISLEMFRSGKLPQDIAKERDLVVSTVEGHLAKFVLTGEVSVYDLVKKEKIAAIMLLVRQAETPHASTIKNELGDDYSYGEIRAVINHCRWEEALVKKD